MTFKAVNRFYSGTLTAGDTYKKPYCEHNEQLRGRNETMRDAHQEIENRTITTQRIYQYHSCHRYKLLNCVLVNTQSLQE